MQASRERRLAAAERYVRDLVDGGAPALLVLVAICKLMEAEDTEAIAGITAIDPGRAGFDRAVFPGLPPDFSAAITTVKLQLPFIGSCAKSVGTGKTVTCTDIAGDTEFDPIWRKLCLGCGVQSLQSFPIFSADGRSIGTFVLCYREPSHESRFDKYVMETGARLAALVLDYAERMPLAPHGVEAIQAAE